MLERFAFWRRRTKGHSDAYERGRDVGTVVIKEVHRWTEALYKPRRLNFLSVLDGRIEAIQPAEDISFEEQVEIELKVMAENWFDRAIDQREELLSILRQHLGNEIVDLAPDLLSQIVEIEVKSQYKLLVDEGLQHAAEAFAAKNRADALGKR